MSTLPTVTIAEADAAEPGTVSRVRGGFRVAGNPRTYKSERGARIASARMHPGHTTDRSGHITPKPTPGAGSDRTPPAELSNLLQIRPDTPPRRAGGGRPSTGSGRTATPGTREGARVS